MATQPSSLQSFNATGISGVTGSVSVTYESNSSNNSVGRVREIEVNGSIIDPSSSTASTILSNSNTISAFRTSLSQTNPSYARRVGSNVTPSYSGNASQLYNASLVSQQNVSSTAQQAASGSTPTTTNTSKPSPFNGSTLAYPKDILTEIQEYLQIKAIKYDAPNASNLSGGGQGTGLGILSGGLDSRYQNITQSTLRGISNDLGTVILPMPGGVTDVNGSNWGDAYLNPLSSVGLGAMADIGGSITNPSNVLGSTLDQLNDAKNAVNSDAGKFAAAYGVSRALQQVNLNVDENELLARTTGYISNPNAELLYKGPRLRQFSFTYRMTPRTSAEAIIIRKIVRFFKQSMAAKKSTFLLATPSVFFLEYKRKSGNKTIKSLNKFKPCALTQFNIDNSTSQYWNSYYDDISDESQPISTTIQLSFQEITPIFYESYSEFSDTDDVGY